MPKTVTDEEIRHTRYWLTQFSKDARQEPPLKMHSSTPGGLGAAPPFTDSFIGYIGELECKVDGCVICIDRKRQPKQQLVSEDYRLAHQVHSPNRTTKALRKLRKVAPLEFDVLWLAIMQGLTVAQIVERLNDRAISRGHLDEVYDHEMITLLVVSGVDKVGMWY